MIIQCGKCGTQFRVDDAKLPAGGTKVRCSKCGHQFVADGSNVVAGAPAKSASGSSVVPSPQAASATPTTPSGPPAMGSVSSGVGAAAGTGAAVPKASVTARPASQSGSSTVSFKSSGGGAGAPITPPSTPPAPPKDLAFDLDMPALDVSPNAKPVAAPKGAVPKPPPPPPLEVGELDFVDDGDLLDIDEPTKPLAKNPSLDVTAVGPSPTSKPAAKPAPVPAPVSAPVSAPTTAAAAPKAPEPMSGGISKTAPSPAKAPPAAAAASPFGDLGDFGSLDVPEDAPTQVGAAPLFPAEMSPAPTRPSAPPSSPPRDAPAFSHGNSLDELSGGEEMLAGAGMSRDGSLISSDDLPPAFDARPVPKEDAGTVTRNIGRAGLAELLEAGDGEEAKARPTLTQTATAPKPDVSELPRSPLAMVAKVALSVVVVLVLLVGALLFVGGESLDWRRLLRDPAALRELVRPPPPVSFEGVQVVRMRSVLYPVAGGEWALVFFGEAKNTAQEPRRHFEVVAELRDAGGRVLASQRGPLGIGLSAPDVARLEKPEALAELYKTRMRESPAAESLEPGKTAPFTIVLLQPPPQVERLQHEVALKVGEAWSPPPPAPEPVPEDADEALDAKGKKAKGKLKGKLKGKAKAAETPPT